MASNALRAQKDAYHKYISDSMDLTCLMLSPDMKHWIMCNRNSCFVVAIDPYRDCC